MTSDSAFSYNWAILEAGKFKSVDPDYCEQVVGAVFEGKLSRKLALSLLKQSSEKGVCSIPTPMDHLEVIEDCIAKGISDPNKILSAVLGCCSIRPELAKEAIKARINITRGLEANKQK